MKEKIIKLTYSIFSKVTALLMIAILFVGAAYVAALIVGGETALKINEVITGIVLPVICITSVSLSVLGIINMYLRGEKAFVLEIHREEKD